LVAIEEGGLGDGAVNEAGRRKVGHDAGRPACADAWPSGVAVSVVRTAAPGAGEHGRYRHGGRILQVREARREARALLEELADAS
jgi:hypothetical protein